MTRQIVQPCKDLTGQNLFLIGHCLLTVRYFEALSIYINFLDLIKGGCAPISVFLQAEECQPDTSLKRTFPFTY